MCPLLLIAALKITPSQSSEPGATTTSQDYERLLKQLGITSTRPGVDGMHPTAPNYANTDESKANPYPNIPEVLKFKNGKIVKNARDWKKRRLEIMEDLDREVYGRTPKNTPKVTWEVTKTESNRDNTTTKYLTGHVDNRADPAIKVDISVLEVTRNDRTNAPLMLEFGFPSMRGMNPKAPTWRQQVLEQGWGYAILNPMSVQADNGAGLTQGIIGLCNKGQPRKVDDWGALKAWAWGADRFLDYLQSDPRVNSKKVGIEGISRFGKAAAVTMAYCPRFAIAFVGSSGQGGVKIWRRNSGETVENVASSGEYHWMAGNYVKYAGPLTPNDFPVDAHELVALCAPRPVFVGVGSPNVEGVWIDSRGTFIATSLASPVYSLVGKKGLNTTEMPAEGTPLIDGDLAFSQHHGGHTNDPNWPTFIEFAKRYFNP